MTGGELFERVAETDCLTEKEASFYMYQLLQALQHMHSKNIVHLDLKVTFGPPAAGHALLIIFAWKRRVINF